MCKASDYLDLVQWAGMNGDSQPCEHGHFGCATTDGGKCSDEMAHQCGCEDCTGTVESSALRSHTCICKTEPSPVVPCPVPRDQHTPDHYEIHEGPILEKIEGGNHKQRFQTTWVYTFVWWSDVTGRQRGQVFRGERPDGKDDRWAQAVKVYEARIGRSTRIRKVVRG